MQTIEVLGSGCANCQRLAALTEQALADLGRGEQVQKITDFAAIAAYGAMSMPALAVDGKVILSGRIPALETLKEKLQAAG